MCNLAKRFGVSLADKMERQMAKKGSSEIEETVKQIIINFYERPDIVYICPGMNDKITFWEDGKKITRRKMYLTMYLKEVFQLFKDSYPDVKIGFSKFADLRPPHVLLKQHSVDQCKCETHENFLNKLKPLKISYCNDFWNNILCESDNLSGNCWTGKCEKCEKGKLLLFDSVFEKEVVWDEWVKGESGRLKVETKKGCLGQLK